MADLKEQQLTLEEFNKALHIPTPHRNKKKYTRKDKHRKKKLASGKNNSYL